MTDQISRQALKNSLTNWQMEYAEKGKDVERFETLGAVIELVEQFPTIDPVKHGKWNCDKDGLVWCCLCGFGKERSDERFYSYCPNCGASMERSEDETH